MAKKSQSEALPASLPERITLVGEALYGRDFRRRLAGALSISRTTLWEMMKGAGKRRDIDGRLIDLLDAEHDAATVRGIEIAALRRRFIAIRRHHDAAL